MSAAGLETGREESGIVGGSDRGMENPTQPYSPTAGLTAQCTTVPQRCQKDSPQLAYKA